MDLRVHLKREKLSSTNTRTIINHETSNVMSIVPLAFLTINTILTIIRNRNDATTTAYVVFAYANFLLLFWCLQAFKQTTPENSRETGRLKLPTWVLSTSLLIVMAYRVSAILSPTTIVLVWAIAIASSLSGFYAFFINHDGEM